MPTYGKMRLQDAVTRPESGDDPFQPQQPAEADSAPLDTILKLRVNYPDTSAKTLDWCSGWMSYPSVSAMVPAPVQSRFARLPG
jgi:hypothetical protein